ncbi:MAG: hypothetical protein ACI814_003803, partial [Mariniblastus sp.]
RLDGGMINRLKISRQATTNGKNPIRALLAYASGYQLSFCEINNNRTSASVAKNR